MNFDGLPKDSKKVCGPGRKGWVRETKSFQEDVPLSFSPIAHAEENRKDKKSHLLKTRGSLTQEEIEYPHFETKTKYESSSATFPLVPSELSANTLSRLSLENEFSCLDSRTNWYVLGPNSPRESGRTLKDPPGGKINCNRRRREMASESCLNSFEDNAEEPYNDFLSNSQKTLNNPTSDVEHIRNTNNLNSRNSNLLRNENLSKSLPKASLWFGIDKERPQHHRSNLLRSEIGRPSGANVTTMMSSSKMRILFAARKKNEFVSPRPYQRSYSQSSLPQKCHAQYYSPEAEMSEEDDEVGSGATSQSALKFLFIPTRSSSSASSLTPSHFTPSPPDEKDVCLEGRHTPLTHSINQNMLYKNNNNNNEVFNKNGFYNPCSSHSFYPTTSAEAAPSASPTNDNQNHQYYHQSEWHWDKAKANLDRLGERVKGFRIGDFQTKLQDIQSKVKGIQKAWRERGSERGERRKSCSRGRQSEEEYVFREERKHRQEMKEEDEVYINKHNSPQPLLHCEQELLLKAESSSYLAKGESFEITLLSSSSSASFQIDDNGCFIKSGRHFFI